MNQKPTNYEKMSSDSIGNQKPADSLKKKFRLLICSPSNGGCDELTRRLKQLRKDRTSALHAVESMRGSKLSIVRVGRSESIHADCDDVVFEVMVKGKIDELMMKKQSERSNSLSDHYHTLLNTE